MRGPFAAIRSEVPLAGSRDSRDNFEFEAPTRLHATFQDEPTRFGSMVGRSASMRAFFTTLQKAATTNATILLEGETGTGKEASAEAIHRASSRRDGPFVVIDCGAIPPQLLEGELFGSERGAYTGSVAAREGAFAAASGGTIFLDELGELPLDLQPKILRAVEQRQIKRVGSNTYLPVDLRFIAATNRSLRLEVEEKKFRSDLYYRLAVVQIKLPPLRERIADLPLLVDHFLASLDMTKAPEAAPLREQKFIDKLASYRWPGNVRQLRNYVERCLALGDPHTPIAPDTVAPPPPPSSRRGVEVDTSLTLKVAREDCVNRFEAEYLRTILAQHEDNIAAAARAAGVDRVHFYRLLWKHGLKPRHSEPDETRGATEPPRHKS